MFLRGLYVNKKCSKIIFHHFPVMEDHQLVQSIVKSTVQSQKMINKGRKVRESMELLLRNKVKKRKESSLKDS